MAALMEKIYETAMQNYNMTLLAGESGLYRLIDWVHVVEEIDYIEFLKGRELIVTTGIKEPDEAQLLEFTTRVWKAQASGLVINVGKYIPEIPGSVLEFGAEHNFPIFTLPWKVHLVDFNRELCNLIYKSEEQYATLYSAVQKALFYPDEAIQCQKILRQEGITAETPIRLIQCYTLPAEYRGIQNAARGGDCAVSRFYSWFYQNCQQLLHGGRHRFTVFQNPPYTAVVVFGLNEQEIRHAAEKMRELCSKYGGPLQVYLSASGSDTCITNLSEKYHITSLLCRQGAKEGRNLSFEEESGIWRMLLGIQDRRRLIYYKEQVLGELERIDAETETVYMKLLETYLEVNGNMQEAASRCYLHRNTVAYHLKRIAEITGRNLNSAADRNELYLAFQIRKLLEL